MNSVDAGYIDPAFGPSGLAAHAPDCVDLALDTVNEVKGANPDDDVIGSDLKTIKNLLTTYRTEAGIE